MTEARKTLSIKPSTPSINGRATTDVKSKRRHHHKPGTAGSASAQQASRDLSARAAILKKSKEQNGDKKPAFQGQTFTPIFKEKPKKPELKPVVVKSAPEVAKPKKFTPKKEFTNASRYLSIGVS